MKKIYLYSFLILFGFQSKAQWTEIDSGVNTAFFTNVFAIAPNTAIVVGTDGYILKTIDGGETWQQKESGTNEILWKVEFPTPETGYIVGSGGVLLKTTDGGETWDSLNIEPTNWWPSLSCVNENLLFTITTDGLVKSTDGGETWSLTGTTPSSQGYYSGLGSFQFLNENTGYIGSVLWAMGDWENTKFFKTNDTGITWQEITGTAPFKFTDENTGYYYLGGLHKTTDGGNSFETLVVNEYYDEFFSLSDIFVVNENTIWGIVYLALLDYDTSSRAIIKISSEDSENFSENILWDNNPEIDMLSISFADENNGYIVGSKYGKATIWKNGTGINDFSISATKEFNKNPFKIYPNPAQNEINLELDQSISGMITVMINEFSGKNVLTKDYTGLSKFKIDVSQFHKGVYILTIKTSTNKYSQKIIVN